MEGGHAYRPPLRGRPRTWYVYLAVFLVYRSGRTRVGCVIARRSHQDCEYPAQGLPREAAFCVRPVDDTPPPAVPEIQEVEQASGNSSHRCYFQRLVRERRACTCYVMVIRAGGRYCRRETVELARHVFTDIDVVGSRYEGR